MQTEKNPPGLLFDLWGSTDQIDEADLEDVRSYAAFAAMRKIIPLPEEEETQ